MAPTPNPARRPLQVRTRTRPQPPRPEADLRALLGLDKLDEADADALLIVQVLDLTEGRLDYHQAVGIWLGLCRRLDDNRQYIVRHGFVALITRHDGDWSWSVARELQPGAQPGPTLASCRRYSSSTAAKIAAYDFVADLSAAEQRAAGDAP